MKRTIAVLMLLLCLIPGALSETLTLSFVGACSIGERVEAAGQEGT